MANDLTTRTPPTLPQPVAVPRLRDMGLEGWNPAMPVPATKAQLSTALDALSRSLTPADAKHRAIFEVLMGDFFATQNIPVAPDYWEQVWVGIPDLPADLLGIAARRIISEWRWAKTPRPGDYRAAVADRMAERSLARARVSTALMRAPETLDPPRRRVSPERIAEIVSAGRPTAKADRDPTPEELERTRQRVQREAQQVAAESKRGAA